MATRLESSYYPREMQIDKPVAWSPHPGAQTNAITRMEFENLVGGSRGGGKTEIGQGWLAYDIHHPKYKFLVIRKNAEDLNDWLSRARSFYKPTGADITGKPGLIRFPSGAEGRLGHLKDENAYEKYQGHEYHKILIEELTHIPSEERYLKLIASCRSTIPELRPQVMATTNPGGPGHVWVKRRFVDVARNKRFVDPESGRSRIFSPVSLYDNPTLMKQDPSYEGTLKALPEKLRRAWLYGDWTVFEGQFFSEFDEHHHIYEPFEIPKAWPRFRSMDWGYSDHFCCLWFAVGPDNHIYVYREFYQNRLTDSEYAEAVNGLSKYSDGSDERIEYTIGDPVSFWNKIPETGVERWETYALNNIPILKGDNKRVNGWGRVREYLKLRDYQHGQSPWLHISRECKNLSRTLPKLVHDDRVVEDVADGMEDHAPDALRLGLQSRTPTFTSQKKKYRDNYEAAEAQMKRLEKRGIYL